MSDFVLSWGFPMFSEVLRHEQRGTRSVTCSVEEQIQAELGLKRNSFLSRNLGWPGLSSGGQLLLEVQDTSNQCC